MNMTRGILAGLLLAVTGSVWAQANPAGLWRTIDDESGKEKSLVRIVESGGVSPPRWRRSPTRPRPARCATSAATIARASPSSA
jgi:hypothetical protein